MKYRITENVTGKSRTFMPQVSGDGKTWVNMRDLPFNEKNLAESFIDQSTTTGIIHEYTPSHRKQLLG